ncbi:MAG TPA: hypothetical protein VLJ21_04035 [Candidatus Binatia bacterium]|nr:hypothetical protein [Candidatus Binatia bacterium]
MTKTVDQQNLGRVAAALDLEDLVVSDGYLPTIPLAERGKLVRGVIAGLVENGDLSRAIKLVYTQTPARGLFEDWDEFRSTVVARLKKGRKGSLTEEALSIVANNWSTDDVYAIALTEGFHEEQRRRLFDTVQPKLTKEQSAAYFRFEGDIALKHGNYECAIEFLVQNAHSEHIDRVYTTILNDKADRNALPYQMPWLVALAEKSGNNKAVRQLEIARHALAKKVASWHDGHFHDVRLYDFVVEKKIPLTAEEMKRLRELSIDYIASESVLESEDAVLQKLWVTKRGKKDPATAYRLYGILGESGPDALAAAKAGLLNQDQDGRALLKASDVQENHLRSLYAAMPLWSRKEIAEHLKDATLLKDLAREFYAGWKPSQEAHEYRDRVLNAVYDLWVKGKGSFDDPFIKNVRASMIEKAMTRNTTPDFYREDILGLHEFFERVIDKNPQKAYDWVDHTDQQKLIQRAREKYATQDPAGAVRYFASSLRNDMEGVRIATEALATQYKISIDVVQPFVQKIIDSNKRSR